MSHIVYTTPGIVLQRRGAGEKHFFVRVLTRDLGLVPAKAISARVYNSKLRPSTTPFTLGEFSFVRGKEIWRLVNCIPGDNLYLSPSTRSLHKRFMAKAARMILNMSPLEEVNKNLYNFALGGFRGAPSCLPEIMPLYELSVVTRILSALGYMPDTEATRPIISSQSFDSSLARHAKENRKELHRLIHQAFEVSHLGQD